MPLQENNKDESLKRQKKKKEKETNSSNNYKGLWMSHLGKSSWIVY